MSTFSLKPERLEGNEDKTLMRENTCRKSIEKNDLSVSFVVKQDSNVIQILN